MKIGDIHWVDLPTNGGREQQGRRPAIIVQDENYGGRLPTVFVIPLSSTRNALRFAGTALIAANLTSGLVTILPHWCFNAARLIANELASELEASRSMSDRKCSQSGEN